MAARALERRAAAEAARREPAERKRAELDAAFPPLPGEDAWVDPEGPHAGHRSHMCWDYPGSFMCSCGELAGGCFSFVLPDEPLPPCGICLARGISPGSA